MTTYRPASSCAARKLAPACNDIVTFFPKTVQRRRCCFDVFRDQAAVISQFRRWHRACSVPVEYTLAKMRRTTVMLHVKVTALLLLLMCCALFAVNYWLGLRA